MVWLGTNALSVYGVIVNISTFVQCCAYSVGQASQPIISTNFGAGKGGRIRETLKYALGTVAVFSIFWTALSMLIPNVFIRFFMTPTGKVLEIAPMIFRCYGLSFLLLPLNIFSTYYFQALMKLYLLPEVFGGNAIWFAMPVTELLVSVYVIREMIKYTKQLSTERKR